MIYFQGWLHQNEAALLLAMYIIITILIILEVWDDSMGEVNAAECLSCPWMKEYERERERGREKWIWIE